jgi:hypothetical protein
MDRAAKVELAQAILDTLNARERTYNREKQQYAINYRQAADKAVRDPELRPLVTSMLMAGYCDFPEWAEKITGDRRQQHKRGR